MGQVEQEVTPSKEEIETVSSFEAVQIIKEFEKAPNAPSYSIVSKGTLIKIWQQFYNWGYELLDERYLNIKSEVESNLKTIKTLLVVDEVEKAIVERFYDIMKYLPVQQIRFGISFIIGILAYAKFSKLGKNIRHCENIKSKHEEQSTESLQDHNADKNDGARGNRNG